MTDPDASATHFDSTDKPGASAEPSVTSSLERLVAGSQGVIAKQIDLALLEGQEMMSRTLQRAALVAAATLLAVVAWLAAAVSLVELAAADASVVTRLALFALLNGGAAIGLVLLARRAQLELEAPANTTKES